MSVLPEIGWCNNCNVPILDGRNCGICGLHSFKLKFTKAELKPIFKEEKDLYGKVLAKENNHFCNHLPKGLCFYNIMGEIVVDGKKIFRLSYDERKGSWRIAFFNGLAGNVSALKGSDLRDTIKANEQILREKEREATKFLRETIKKYAHLPLAVSFSGGKDSAASLYLTRLVRRKVDAIFLNTTVEFDETVNYVHDLTRMWNVNLVEAHPPQSFFDLCDQLGPPSVKMKWCCKTQKFSPQNQLINNRYPDGVLAISGIRKKESNIRSKFNRIQVNKMIPRQTLAFPILNWGSLDVWLYLLWKKIPYNVMYNYGFSRIGCWACPEKSLRDFELVRTVHPDLSKKLGLILAKHAKKLNIEDVSYWIRSGKWRVRKTKWVKSIACTSSHLCSGDDQMVYTFSNGAMSRVKEFMKVFGHMNERGSMAMITNPSIEITMIGNKMRTKLEDPKILPVFEKQLTRALNCVGCGACVGTCESGALKVESGEIKVGGECTNCLQCIRSNGIRMSCVSVNYNPNILSVN